MTLDLSSSKWDLSLHSFDLFSQPLGHMQCIIDHSVRSALTFECTGIMKWLLNLGFSSPVESASGRKFGFFSDSSFQLSAAAAVPDQRRSHKMKRS